MESSRPNARPEQPQPFIPEKSKMILGSKVLIDSLQLRGMRVMKNVPAVRRQVYKIFNGYLFQRRYHLFLVTKLYSIPLLSQYSRHG
jgi:hypothetical protein